MTTRTGPLDRVAVLELLSDVALRVASTLHLETTLDAIVRAVVDSLGFEAAVLNVRRGDQVDVAAVAGPDELRAALEGTSQPLELWEQMLDRSQSLGALRFIDGRVDSDEMSEMLSWVPDLPVVDDPAYWHPLDALFAPLWDDDGGLLGVLSVDVPVDRRRPDAARRELIERFAALAGLAIDRARAHDRVSKSAELFRRTFDDAPLAMALLHLDGRIDQVNAAYRALAGDLGPVQDMTCWDLVHAGDRDEVRAAIEQVATGAVPVLDGEIRDREGRHVVRATVSRLDAPDGVRLLVQMVDVTAQRAAHDALRAQATTDPLTGLRNRTGLTRHLARLLAERDPERVAVLFCDLDLFKLVNDTYGHGAGDALLTHIAESLASELRGDDIAARFGGDEFVVALADCDGAPGAIAVAERLRDAVARSQWLGDVVVTPSVSIGIAVASAGTTADQLLADADTALYRAKDAGRGRWELFATDMRLDSIERLRLREELRAAVDQDELRLHYQPILELATGRTMGFEALLRWEHPRHGLLAPGAFLDEVMRSGLDDSITNCVIDEAIATASTWPSDDGAEPAVTINISPHQLHRPDLVGVIGGALRRYALRPERLCVEVTEEAVVAEIAQVDVLRALREMGVHVALDDFGSGYAGLLALRDVPADVVKLDRELTARITTDPTSALIVAAMIGLCRDLGLWLVAEGIEEAATVDALRQAGVQFAQGYYFGRPAALAASPGADEAPLTRAG